MACGGGESVALDDVPAENARVACRKIFECCDAAERGGFSPPFTTEEECVASQRDFIESFFGSTRAAVEAGTIIYDGELARACFDVHAAQTCAEFATSLGLIGDTTPDCENALAGTISDGLSCDLDDECVTGYCESGVCRAVPIAGESCLSRCAGGLHCSANGCVSRLVDGAACDSDDECVSGGCVGAPGMCGAPAICNGV
jgi:hypothetical protein